MSNIPSWDPIWEKVFSEQEWGKYPPEHVIRFVARSFYKAPDRKQVKLLDLGSGTGACAWFMAREGFDVSSIEGSKTAVAQARERFSRENLAGDLRVGDFIELPWPDEHFDGVVENAALCCNRFDQCKRVVAEARRVLKPGGHFLSSNLSNETWGYGIGEEVERNTFRNISQGPLQNRGLALLMDRAQVDELYSPFKDVRVEKATWTMDSLQHCADWWIVESRKAS
jgi:SAM-dependent methyltransferase